MTIDERQALIEQYKAGYDEVVESLRGLSEDELSAHPIEGKWSAREIVHHLADSESTSAIRLRKLFVEDQPQIQGYDEAEFARRLKYNERPIAPALAAFHAARETTAQILPLLSDEDFSREGTHTESGRYTIEDWLRIYAAHAHNHAAQIRRLREALKRQ
ncbi:MAG: hypothetical protein AUG51_09585 [Acidobacteria bacterium 13_1_20CM_3_53_8]|nr:MAG: hypothetical protein AUG51_09585 [Acidobacteria bacterium 13_1_20CM_3_53_8]